MNLALSIALSHLLSRRRQTVVSLMGMALGVAFFLAVSALMQGSEDDFIKRLVDNSPHVTVYDEYREPRSQPAAEAYPDALVEICALKPRTEVRGIRQYKEKLDFIASMPRLRVAPVLSGQAIVTFAGKDLGATLNGIVPEMMKHVSTIDEHFICRLAGAACHQPRRHRHRHWHGREIPRADGAEPHRRLARRLWCAP